MQQRCCANFNYNAFSVSLLANAYRVTGEKAFLDAAWQKFRVGIAPGQAPNGRWMDAHNARTVYHIIILRALGDLAAVVGAGRAEVDVVARPAIKALLDGLKDRYGWAGVYEGENIIALSDPNGLGNVSLEPGGQFELSGAPLDTVHETCEEVHEHLTQVREVGDKLGIGFLGLGASPLWSLAETPVMPKGRYGIMAPYMDKVGTRGRDMMFRTCTVQVNLDFASEADMVKKLRVSLALQPIATALFADSPFLDGKPNGFLSYRSEVWRDTDNQRAGMLPFAFEQGFGFEQYVDYALDVPMYFVMRDGKYINTAGESFRDFCARHAEAELNGMLEA